MPNDNLRHSGKLSFCLSDYLGTPPAFRSREAGFLFGCGCSTENKQMGLKNPETQTGENRLQLLRSIKGRVILFDKHLLEHEPRCALTPKRHGERFVSLLQKSRVDYRVFFLKL